MVIKAKKKNRKGNSSLMDHCLEPFCWRNFAFILYRLFATLSSEKIYIFSFRIDQNDFLKSQLLTLVKKLCLSI
jgi:hypothetical protein